MKKNHLLLVLLGIAIAVVVGVYYTRTLSVSQGDRQLPSVSLRLKWLYDPGFAGEMVAAKAGLFEKHGIKVDIKPGGFESDPIKLVASGADTIGVAGADSFLIARSKGVPIVAFAAGYLETGVAFYVHTDSGIASPRDFAGKKVGYQAGQDTATIYEAMMRKLGMNRKDINEIPVKYDFTPFLQRQVDVWPGYAATQAYILEREKVPYRQFLPAQFGISFIGTVYFTTEDYMKKHPDVLAAFTKGLVDGWTLTYSDYKKSVPLVESFDPAVLKPDLIEFNLNHQKSSILPDGYRYTEFKPAQWEALQEILISSGLINQPQDMNSVVSYEFLAKAYQEKTSQ